MYVVDVLVLGVDLLMTKNPAQNEVGSSVQERVQVLIRQHLSASLPPGGRKLPVHQPVYARLSVLFQRQLDRLAVCYVTGSERLMSALI